MPLTMGDNQSVDYFISATDDLGMKTTRLGAGQTVAVTSSDTTTVSITPDTTVRNAPDGSPSVASGKAASVVSSAGGTLNTPVTISAAVSNADGTPGTDDKGVAIAPATDTITVQAGLAHAIGELFGVPA